MPARRTGCSLPNNTVRRRADGAAHPVPWATIRTAAKSIRRSARKARSGVGQTAVRSIRRDVRKGRSDAGPTARSASARAERLASGRFASRSTRSAQPVPMAGGRTASDANAHRAHAGAGPIAARSFEFAQRAPMGAGRIASDAYVKRAGSDAGRIARRSAAANAQKVRLAAGPSAVSKRRHRVGCGRPRHDGRGVPRDRHRPWHRCQTSGRTRSSCFSIVRRTWP